MEIRAIRAEDSRLEISYVYEQSWKSAYKGIIPKSYLNSIPTGRWADRIDSFGRNTLIVLEQGRIIGTSSFGKSRFADMSCYGEIYSIYLLPEYVGKGIGKALLTAVIEALLTLEYHDVFLWVLEENEHARQFYEREGFKCSGKFLNDNIGGRPIREVEYILHIE